jgi:8-oxo-dGTP diphosphatase
VRIRQKVQTVPRSTKLGPNSSRTHVVAGILQDADDRILIADRAQSKSMQEYWEFPGGKVDRGESAEAALHRELAEELGIDIEAPLHFKRLTHDYPDLSVAIDFYLVRGWLGTPSGLEGQQIQWVSRSMLGAQNLLPADAPIIEALSDL